MTLRVLAWTGIDLGGENLHWRAEYSEFAAAAAAVASLAGAVVGPVSIERDAYAAYASPSEGWLPRFGTMLRWDSTVRLCGANLWCD